jgi:hypothetical protein
VEGEEENIDHDDVTTSEQSQRPLSLLCSPSVNTIAVLSLTTTSNHVAAWRGTDYVVELVAKQSVQLPQL